MKRRDELAREVEVLGARIATLSAAVPRLGSSLDLATEERRELAEWPDGPKPFSYLRDLPGSSRFRRAVE